MLMLITFLLVALQLSLTVAQNLPFLVTGFLESAQANPGSEINRGGTVSVAGFNDIVIPNNLLVEFPALFVPFAEFTEGNRAGTPANEVTITGNIVGTRIIAAQMSISQLDLAFGAGVIDTLSNDGKIQIKNGPIVRINDPRGKYGAEYTALPFYTADDENPSISSFSGFPVCVPRSSADDKCPQTNRGGNGLVPDPLKMAPLRPGDYIEFSGVQFGGMTVVYGLVANIDLRTSGSQPGFVRVEDAIIGVASTDADVEAARLRFIGLATRSDLPINIYAIDQDSCTGKETDRLITSTSVIASARNKWTVDVPRNTPVGYYTRSYRITIGDNVVTTNDGIKAGQYVQPVSEWIFPELVTPGGAPPPNDFTNFGFLVNGFGPINGKVFGQLDPWPGATKPASNQPSGGCPTVPDEVPEEPTGPTDVVASAGEDQIVLGGVAVTLSAKAGTLPATGLTFEWAQISPGNVVTLSSKTAQTVTFNAPVLASSAANVNRTFAVTITHTATGTKSNDTINVVSIPLKNTNTVFDKPIIDSLTWATKQSGTATALAHSNLVDSTASMRIIFNSDTTERVMTKVSTANGRATYSYSNRDIKKYTLATVRSYLNGVRVGGGPWNSTAVGLV